MQRYITLIFFLLFSGSMDFFFLTTHGTRINPELRFVKNLFTREGFCAVMSDFNCTLISQGSCNKVTTSSRIFMKTSSKRSPETAASDESGSKKIKDSKDSI